MKKRIYFFLVTVVIFGCILSSGCISVTSENTENNIGIVDVKAINALALSIGEALIGPDSQRQVTQSSTSLSSSGSTGSNPINTTIPRPKDVQNSASIQNYGTLSVTSTPTESKVYIDGKYRGITPLVIDLAPGTYTVDVRKAEASPGKSQSVTITSGNTTTKTFVLSNNFILNTEDYQLPEADERDTSFSEEELRGNWVASGTTPVQDQAITRECNVWYVFNPDHSGLEIWYNDDVNKTMKSMSFTWEEERPGMYKTSLVTFKKGEKVVENHYFFREKLTGIFVDERGNTYKKSSKTW